MNQSKFYFFCLLLSAMVFVSGCDKEKSKTKEEQEIELLFNKITNLAQNSSCGNTTNYELKFIEYGFKSCGGPVGYLAYSTSIDIIQFEKLIYQYANLQKKYDKKWDVISTCNIPTKPKSVTCENGKPKLVY